MVRSIRRGLQAAEEDEHEEADSNVTEATLGKSALTTLTTTTEEEEEEEGRMDRKQQIFWNKNL